VGDEGDPPSVCRVVHGCVPLRVVRSRRDSDRIRPPARVFASVRPRGCEHVTRTDPRR